MRRRTVFAALALVGLVAGLGLMKQPAGGVTAQLPEFVLKDDNGVVIGGLAATATTGLVAILVRDPVNNENFHLQFGVNQFRGTDDDDVWFDDTTCGQSGGDAYVLEPSFFSSGLPGLRGSVYGVGPGPKIYRGTGAGANHGLDIKSKYHTHTINAPTCTMETTSSPTVLASEVLDLTGIVAPYKVE